MGPAVGGQAGSGSLHCVAAPAVCAMAEAERPLRGQRSAGRPGERTGWFRDRSGRAITTPSRPIPRLLPKAHASATKLWYSFYRRPGVSKDAGSKFQERKKCLKVSWAPCKRDLRAVPGRASVPPGVSPSGALGYNGGPTEAVSPSVENLRSDLSSSLAAVNANNKRVVASEGRCASSHSLPDCWIADTGCGFDLLCGRWVTKPDKG